MCVLAVLCARSELFQHVSWLFNPYHLALFDCGGDTARAFRIAPFFWSDTR